MKFIFSERFAAKGIVFAFAVLLLLFGFTSAALAQTETGQIVGTVTDPSGAVVPNAKVTITNVGTGAERTTTTDDRGTYTATNLLPAVYSVTVEATGFAKTEKRVQVTVGARVALDFELQVGAAVQVVEVTAEAGVAVNTETQTVGQVIDSKKITELPTLTRNPYALALTAGNVSPADPTGRGVGVAINGLRAASTNVLLDGAANNDEFIAATGQSVPLDAVQEFSLLTTNYTAEFGRASGGIVNVATKSGTNAFHGTAYEFNRVSRLASNTFDNSAQIDAAGNWAPVRKGVFTRNQFGYAVGGPVMKDKLLFFQSTEWIRVRSSSPRQVWIPTPELIAASAPATRAYFSAYGTPKSGMVSLGRLTKDAANVAIPGGLCNAGGPCAALPGTTPVFDHFAYSRPSDAGGGDPQNTYLLVGRVDWNISGKTQLYGRYALESGDFLKGSVADSAYQGFDTGQKVFNNNYLVSLTHSWTPRLTMQTKVVYNRLNTLQPHAEQPSSPTLFIRSSATRILGDLIALPGYLPFSPGSGIPFGGPQNFGQVYQDMSYVRGSHQLRFGGSYVYLQDNRTFGAYQDPSATLSGSLRGAMDNYLNGVLLRFESAIDPQGKFPCNQRVTRVSGRETFVDVVTPQCTVNLPVGQPSFSRSNRYHEFAFYAQDSWRATPRLTFNFGLRWEYFGVQHNKDPNRDSNYYDAAVGNIFQGIRGGDLATTPNSPIKGLWKKDWNNFAPRIGFAWDMFGTGKTALRGGWGMGYERNFGNVTFNVIQNPPNYLVISLTAPVDLPVIPIPVDVAGPLSGSTGSKSIPRGSLRNVDSNIQTAYAHFWSLTLEHEALKNFFVAVDYSGSKGQKLYSLENPNRIGSGNVFLGDPCLDRVLNVDTNGDGIPDATDGLPDTGVTGSCQFRLRIGQYTNINRRSQQAFSLHNAMNVRVNLRNVANSGLTLTSNYTWAHTIDNLSSTFSESGNNFNLGLTDAFNPNLDRGNADFDIRHRFVVSGTWEVPFAKSTTGVVNRVLHGWSINPIFTANTGTPFTVWDCNLFVFSICPRMFEATAISRTGVANPQDDSVSGTPNFLRFIEMPMSSVDESYANPITGSAEFGPYPANMTGRNVFRGPGAWGVTLGLYKTTKVNERFSVQFRAELFNALNHANMFVLGSQADVAEGNEFIPAARDGRRNVQLALKLIF